MNLEAILNMQSLATSIVSPASVCTGGGSGVSDHCSCRSSSSNNCNGSNFAGELVGAGAPAEAGPRRDLSFEFFVA